MPLEYLAAARSAVLGFFEYAVLSILVLQAKDEGDTGVIHTSARALATRWRGLQVKTAQRLLERLEARGFIRRYLRQGDSGPYPLAINGYIRQAGKRQSRLDAPQSESWREPVFVEVTPSAQGSGEGSDEATGQGTGQATPLLRSEVEVEVPSAAAEAPPDADAPGGREEVASPQADAPRPGKPVKTPAPTQRLIALWHLREAARGVAAEPNERRLARAMADLFATAQEDVDRAEAAVAAYFDDDASPTSSTGWSIGYFQTHFRSYLPRFAAPPAALSETLRAVSADALPQPASKDEASAAAAEIRARLNKRGARP